MEAEWNAGLAAYESKYPEEAKEFKQLISGDLPEGWEKALPVSLQYWCTNMELMTLGQLSCSCAIRDYLHMREAESMLCPF